MAELINLNKRRKAAAKVAAKRTADTNAVAFGRTKAEKDAVRAEQTRAHKTLDQHKKDP